MGVRGVFVLEAGLLVWHGVVHQRFQLSRGPSFQRVLSWGLIAYALLYPAIARADGHAFPRLVAVVPLIWAFIGGSAAFVFGVRADLMLLACGVALAVDLIRPRGEKRRWFTPVVDGRDLWRA
jgi:hypothetical protein